MPDLDQQTFIDRSNIIDTLNRFVLSIDQRDWKTMRDSLCDEIDFDYSALNAVMPQTADELVKQVQQDQSNFKAVQHSTTNHQVNLKGDTADCIANVRAQHLLPDDRPNHFWTVIGRYTYSLSRTTTGWKIQKCIIHVYWTETDGKLEA